MNCPACGRELAAGARRCVYCAHGTEVRSRPPLVIPKGTVPERRRGSRWGWVIALVVLAAAGYAAYRSVPAVRSFVDGLLGKLF